MEPGNGLVLSHVWLFYQFSPRSLPLLIIAAMTAFSVDYLDFVTERELSGGCDARSEVSMNPRRRSERTRPLIAGPKKSIPKDTSLQQGINLGLDVVRNPALDPTVLSLVAAALLLVAPSACALPASQASRLNPMQALRLE